MKKRIIFGILIVILLITGSEVRYHMPSFLIRQAKGYINKESEEKLETSEEQQLTEEDFLTVSGRDIVNANGDKINFEGVNIGGWLIQEYWMSPVEGDKDVKQWTNLETLQVLEERFGTEKMKELTDIYEDNWITEEDIQNIAAKGCNVIRVPFWYRNFMSYSDGTWIDDNLDKNPGFQKLDWVIEKAGKYGMYVILDMHGCPGGQSTDHCSGSARKSKLFYSEVKKKAMEKLWIEISKRYKDNPTVAAYDIMNEPETYKGDVESDPRNKLYDRMITAIRKVDKRHIIAVEGIWSLEVLPKPYETSWDNVIYEVHSYGDNPENYCDTIEQYSRYYNIPVYIGEFSDMRILEKCRKLKISYTFWGYKGMINGDNRWFMYATNDFTSVDVNNDPYWLIKLKWGKCLRTQYFSANEEILKYWN